MSELKNIVESHMTEESIIEMVEVLDQENTPDINFLDLEWNDLSYPGEVSIKFHVSGGYFVNTFWIEAGEDEPQWENFPLISKEAHKNYTTLTIDTPLGIKTALVSNDESEQYRTTWRKWVNSGRKGERPTP